jgi:hypothetical protein
MLFGCRRFASALTFNTDSLNQLTTVTRANSYTVAGKVSLTPTSVTVKDNANSAAAATVHGDNGSIVFCGRITAL